METVPVDWQHIAGWNATRDCLDAYAVRKAVPRILIAVIGINLSIYLCLAAVDITNVIGRGIAGLITTPFVKGGNYDFFVEGNVENAASITGRMPVKAAPIPAP